MHTLWTDTAKLALTKKYSFVQATPLQLSPYSAVISKASYQIALNYGGVTSRKGILWIMAVYKCCLNFLVKRAAKLKSGAGTDLITDFISFFCLQMRP